MLRGDQPLQHPDINACACARPSHRNCLRPKNRAFPILPHCTPCSPAAPDAPSRGPGRPSGTGARRPAGLPPGRAQTPASPEGTLCCPVTRHRPVPGERAGRALSSRAGRRPPAPPPPVPPRPSGALTGRPVLDRKAALAAIRLDGGHPAAGCWHGQPSFIHTNEITSYPTHRSAGFGQPGAVEIPLFYRPQSHHNRRERGLFGCHTDVPSPALCH